MKGNSIWTDPAAANAIGMTYEKEPQYYSKRSMGGGSVIVWAAFGYNGRTPIVLLNG